MKDAPPLVFLHGIGTGPEAWQPQVEAFRSSREVFTPTVAPSLARASSELDSLGLARADLCGLSWGSLVALRYAIDRPERVSRLVLAAGFASLPAHLRTLQYVMSVLVRVVPSAPHEYAGPMREGARFDVREQARHLYTPTLVLCGERDRMNHSLSRSLASLLPDAQFEIVPGAGHVANVDNPHAFNASLDAFLVHAIQSENGVRPGNN
jgi:3-oxoadipate enol-lactonase